MDQTTGSFHARKSDSRNRTASSGSTSIIGVGLRDQDAVLCDTADGVAVRNELVVDHIKKRSQQYSPRVRDVRHLSACGRRLDFDSASRAMSERRTMEEDMQSYLSPYIEFVTVFPETVTPVTVFPVSMDPTEIP